MEDRQKNDTAREEVKVLVSLETSNREFLGKNVRVNVLDYEWNTKKTGKYHESLRGKYLS